MVFHPADLLFLFSATILGGGYDMGEVTLMG
jgi:hypothetical protein